MRTKIPPLPKVVAAMAVATALLLSLSGTAQVSYFTSFDGCAASTCGIWTMSGGFSPNITAAAGTGYTPCNTASARSNIYSSAPTCTLRNTTSLGTSLGSSTTISFIYKCVNYSSGSATAANSGTIIVEWSNNGTTYNTITSFNNASSTSCLTAGPFSFTPSPGPLFIRIRGQWITGDFWLVLDNINILETPLPCAGPLSPGNTQSTANPVCSGSSFTLSMSTPPTGAGLNYQWQSSPDGMAWSNISGATNATHTTSQTTATWYQCVVTCTADMSTGTSTPLQVTMASFLSCYCIPVYSTGSGFGDYINSVVLNGSGSNVINNVTGP
ncbi:MAG: hypothetical protein NZM08_01690, partial [Chitinophagales bacterium]|nr:hypothetical protein [Chitinophagales bacterium]